MMFTLHMDPCLSTTVHMHRSSMSWFVQSFSCNTQQQHARIWQSLACCCRVLCNYIMLCVNGPLVKYNMKVCVFVVDTAKHILCFTLVALTMHCEMPCSVKLVMWVEIFFSIITLYQHTCIREPSCRRGMRSVGSHLMDGERMRQLEIFPCWSHCFELLWHWSVCDSKDIRPVNIVPVIARGSLLGMQPNLE